jgi:tRNA (guanine-N7-)-methyltransferase
MENPTQSRNFYGRKRGKTIKPHQKLWLAQDLGTLVPPGIDPAANPDRLAVDPQAWFPGKTGIWLEIGFGGGEHLVHQAALHPDTGIIGCEPFINGVVMLLGKIRRAGVQNLALYPGDVRDLFDVLPEACLSRVFLNYPDPWPKTRHNRRRFVTPQYLEPLARVMKPGAVLRLATDIPDYIRQALAELPRAGFHLQSPDWDQPWDDWVQTRYEAKALREGRRGHYLTFVRR